RSGRDGIQRAILAADAKAERRAVEEVVNRAVAGEDSAHVGKREHDVAVFGNVDRAFGAGGGVEVLGANLEAGSSATGVVVGITGIGRAGAGSAGIDIVYVVDRQRLVEPTVARDCGRTGFLRRAAKFCVGTCQSDDRRGLGNGKGFGVATGAVRSIAGVI